MTRSSLRIGPSYSRKLQSLHPPEAAVLIPWFYNLKKLSKLLESPSPTQRARGE